MLKDVLRLPLGGAKDREVAHVPGGRSDCLRARDRDLLKVAALLLKEVDVKASEGARLLAAGSGMAPSTTSGHLASTSLRPGSTQEQGQYPDTGHLKPQLKHVGEHLSIATTSAVQITAADVTSAPPPLSTTTLSAPFSKRRFAAGTAIRSSQSHSSMILCSAFIKSSISGERGFTALDSKRAGYLLAAAMRLRRDQTGAQHMQAVGTPCRC